MALIKFDPLRGFEGLTRKMNDLIGNFDQGISMEFGNLTPRVDITEDEKGLYFAIELPGIRKDDIKVTINDEGLLIIKGSKKRNYKVEDKFFIRAERYFGDFTRSFLLPDNVKKDSINAKFDSGVLNISFEKAEPVKPKEVEISIS